MSLEEQENNDKKTKLKKTKLKWWSRIKNEFSDRRKYNKHNLILKITISALFLAIATGLSFIEFSLPTPWGTHFYFRFLDTLILIFATGIVGLAFSMLIALATPWLHFAFHGHNPIETLIFTASNILIVFCLWLFYYFIFKLDVRKKCKVQENNEQKNDDNVHPHQFEKEKWVKKILIIALLVFIFAIIESFAQVSVTKVLLSAEDHSHHDHAHHDHEHSRGVSGLFEGNNFWIGIGIFFGVYMAKYIVMFIVFISLEKQIKLITDRFQILV